MKLIRELNEAAVGFFDIDVTVDNEDFGDNTFPFIYAHNRVGIFDKNKTIQSGSEEYPEILQHVSNQVQNILKKNKFSQVVFGSDITPEIDSMLVKDLATLVFKRWEASPIKDSSGDTYTLFTKKRLL